MKFLPFLLCCGILTIACSEEEDIPTLEVGQDFTSSNVRVISIDTFTVELSTYKIDSITTSSPSRILVGRYIDEIFGITIAKSYMELTPESYSIPNDAKLDSIALILNYDNYFYNDTLKTSSINVHLLKDEVRPEDDVFYNTSTIPHEEAPIATKNYKPEPIREDSLHISIPIDIGQTLFDKIQEGDINDKEELRNELKGFALLPGELDNSSIIGFSTDNTVTYLRFFYTLEDSEFEDDEQTFDLGINVSESFPTYFNNIQSNTDGTFFTTLTDQEINLSSTESNNRSYIQAGVGIITKIQFPTIKKIQEIPGTGTIVDATLRIKSPLQVYSNILPIRDSLFVNNIDQNNNIGNQLANGTNNVFATIDESDKEFNEIVYEIPIGVYLESEISEAPEIDNGIAIFPQNFNDTVNRIVLEGENSTDFEAQLIITYAIYGKDE
ncbi:DUF4270 family protein [Aquimarina algiphila]|uniref:DUF4270 domain-containing protein n=1 Tax=Aquimarina algiphila TaxID=2047982 RepID=A0A554VKL0_9FLAO|nr:DUF4270 family protein [Aquimarina algiphila]TSE08582.1 DUF4270 domain-containing protein [Aquimarina algiphila]